MDLITISQREVTPGQVVDTVNARELWSYLESKQHFSDWMKNRLSKVEWYVSGVDYLIHKSMNQISGKGESLRSVEVTEYFISIDMASDIALLEETDRGREVRKYFIECAKKLKATTVAIDPMQVFEDPAQMRAILLNYCDRVIHLESVVKEQAPLVGAANTLLVASEGSLCITDAAKQLQVQPKFLFAYLQGHDWIYKRQGGRTWIAYQTRLKQGLLEHKIEMVQKRNLLGIDEDKIVEQVRVTAKGLAKLATLLSSPQSA